MEIRKLLIADGSEEFALALVDALRGAYNLRVCRDGLEALEQIRSFRPDVLVLDLMLPGLDGISLLQSVASGGWKPTVLATTRFISEYILESVDRLGVGYLMVKPCDIRATVARIGDLTGRIRQPVPTRPEPRTDVSNLLLTLGIPVKLRGYAYLREAVLLMAAKPGQSITKELYPAVAEQCGAAPIHVERSIRSAIAAAWERRDEQIWRIYFSPGPDGCLTRPTNAEFICRLADSLACAEDINS